MAWKASHKISAWKLYPQWGPNGRGLHARRRAGRSRVRQCAASSGVRNFAVHKGVSLYGMQPEMSSPRDMGNAAKANPDLTFLVYHSAFQPGVKEGPYDPAGRGVDRLIKAHRDAGLPRNGGNLYAELGSTWRYFMSRPDEAAHVHGQAARDLRGGAHHLGHGLRSGTAARKTRSRRSAPSRSAPTIRRSIAIRR